MLSRISVALDESVMGLLALAGLSFGFAPFLFDLPHGIVQGFGFAKWVIIGLFALEYGSNFALSTDWRKFVVNPWRMLDAVIIVVPLLSLLPAISDVASLTPALRIIRLFSILFFAPIVGHGLQRQVTPQLRQAPSGDPKVTVFEPDNPSPSKCDWDGLLK